MKKFSIIYFISTFMLAVSNALQSKGILGPYIGQLGKKIVGYKSLGREIVRTYAKPTKPPSPAQLAQQAKFLICSAIGIKELINVVRPYWDFIVANLNGFNVWMSKNLKRVLTNIDFANIIITTGSYPNISLDANATYDTLSGVVNIPYVTTVPVNASADDVVIALVVVSDEWDPDNELEILKTYFLNNKTRGDISPEYNFTVETGLSLTDIQIYVGIRNPLAASKIETSQSSFENPQAA